MEGVARWKEQQIRDLRPETREETVIRPSALRVLSKFTSAFA